MIIGQSSSKNQIEFALNRGFPNNKQVVRNLGVYFDTNLNFEFHVKKLVQSFYQLRNIAKARHFLNFNDREAYSCFYFFPS